MSSKKIIDIKIKSRQESSEFDSPDNQQEDKIVQFWSGREQKRKHERKEEPEPEIKVERSEKKNRISFNSFKRVNLKSRSFLFLTCLFFLVLAAFIYLSSLGVELQIQPVFSVKTVEDALTIDKNFEEPDFSSKIIPGNFLEEEKEISQQFNSSGILVKEKKARGIIRVYNNYHLPQILVATTRFLSPEEKLFRSKKKVYIPSGTFLDVEVEAAEPGPEYNIGPSAFSVPGLAGSPRYTSVFGKSLAAMQAGFRGEVFVVSSDDLERAEKVLKDKLMGQIVDALQARAGASQLILEDAVSKEVVVAESLAQEGTETREYNYRVKIKAKTLALQRADIEDFARRLVSSEIKPGQRISPDSLRLALVVENMDLDAGKMTVGLRASASIYTYIEADELKRLVVGKTLEQGRQILTDDPRIFTAQIKILPFWKRSFPKNKEKIKVLLEVD